MSGAYYAGYWGMNGSHVMLILNELRQVVQSSTTAEA